MSGPPLLEGRRLARTFRPRRRSGVGGAGEPVRAVRDVTLSVRAGETVGLVGESGCGKSTTGRLLLGLDAPTRGEVRWRGTPLGRLSGPGLRAFRRSVQIVFQDPFASLNPRLTVGSMLREILAVHGLARGPAVERRCAELLELVGLRPDDARRHPHEFSGGQRQRIGIARALSVEPELIVADEPVSALDVSVQAQVLRLLRDLRERLGLAWLLIAHDLAVVRQMCDRVAVMYLGRIVEEAPTERLFEEPRHPYTRALLAAVPRLGGRGGALPPIAGEAGADAPPLDGCPFHPRCPHPLRDAACLAGIPELDELGPGHRVRCIKARRADADAVSLTSRDGRG